MKTTRGQIEPEAKHTPGPWRISCNGVAVVCDCTDPAQCHNTDSEHDYGGALIAESIKWTPNARLIASAPELLAVLEELIGYQNAGGSLTAKTQIICEKARAAIAKAKGQS